MGITYYIIAVFSYKEAFHSYIHKVYTNTMNNDQTEGIKPIFSPLEIKVQIE